MAKLAALFLAQILLTGATLSAQTDSWSWSYSGTSGAYTTSASGTFTTTTQAGGDELVTGVTGVWNGVNITGVLPAYAYYNDNLFTPAAPNVDSNGVAFSTADGHWVSLWSSGATYEWVSPAGNTDTLLTSTPIQFTATQNEAPWEPSDSVAIAGIAIFGVQQFRKRLRTRRLFS